jgi:hypothetical protein
MQPVMRLSGLKPRHKSYRTFEREADMATNWIAEIEHTCGHMQEHEIDGKKSIHDQVVMIQQFKNQECDDCHSVEDERQDGECERGDADWQNAFIVD